MGTHKKGILDGMSGSVGPVIYYIRKGVNCSRSKPRAGKKKKASPAQIAARARFSFLNNYLKQAGKFWSAGFSTYATNLTPMQAAFTCNSQAVTGSYPDFSLDINKIRITTGDLALPKTAEAVSTEKNTVRISWSYDIHDMKVSGDDQAFALLWFPESKLLAADAAGSLRQAKELVIGVDNDLAGQTGHVYLGFRTDNRQRSSESLYLGEVMFRL